MDKTGHVIFGGIIAIILVITMRWGFSYIFSWKELLSIGLITYFYALLPDIDHQNSTITWNFLILGIMGLLYGFILSNAFYMAMAIVLIVFTTTTAKFLSHRGFIHSILVGALFSLPLLYFSLAYAGFGFVIYLSHLIADFEVKLW